MVRYYLLATRSLFGRYSIATLVFTEFGGGFLENDQGRMNLDSKTAPVASIRPSRVAPSIGLLGAERAAGRQRQSVRKAASSVPIMILAFEPPMKACLLAFRAPLVR
jgi:hypothetical protein